MVLATPPESGKILSIRMSRFSGYKSGASTTGQRSWGKSEDREGIQLLSTTKDNNLETKDAAH